MRQNKVIVRDSTGIIETTTVKNLLSSRQNLHKNGPNKNLKPDENPTFIRIDPSVTEFDTEAVIENELLTCNISKSLRYPNAKNILISGSIDDTQVYVIDKSDRDDDPTLVIIKNVTFEDGEKYISGCSKCFNINSDFLVHLDSSHMYKTINSSVLLKCEHIADAVSSILESFGQWMPAINELEAHEFLRKHCNWKNSGSFFFNESHPSFCAAINSIDGINLFELKQKKWRCVTDKYQIASKCRHGQLIEINSYTYTNESVVNDVKLTPFPILEKTKFSGNYFEIMN